MAGPSMKRAVADCIAGCGMTRAIAGGSDDVPRPATPMISRRGAAEAALAVIDEHGLDGFNMALVARRLGVKPPSLYHHFRDRRDVLAEVALLLLDPGTLELVETDWAERLVELCLQTRRSLLRHPKAASLILQHFPRHLLLDEYDRAAREDPLAAELHMAVIEGTEKITFGSALFEAFARSAEVASFPPVDAAAYPTLTASLRANTFADEELFVETLRMFLAGAKARAEAKSWGTRLAF